MRLWGCIGCLVIADPSFAAQAAEAVEASLRKVAVEETPLPETRVLLQNIWARAAFSDGAVLAKLVDVLHDLSLHDAYASRLVIIAAQLLYIPNIILSLRPKPQFRWIAQRSGSPY